MFTGDATLNTGNSSSPDTSASVPSSPAVQPGMTIPTIPDMKPSLPDTGKDKSSEGTTLTPGDAEKEEKKAGTGAEDEKGAEDQKKSEEEWAKRFDQHPRFQELHAKAKAAEEQNYQLQQRLAYLEGQLAGRGSSGEGTGDGEGQGKDADFVNIMDLKDEEITDKMMDKPKEFFGNLARQVVSEVTKILSASNQQMTREQKIQSGFKSFSDANPEFTKMWQSGAITRFMEEHPEHGAISAFHELTKEGSKTAQEKAVAEAVAKALDEERKKAAEERQKAEGNQKAKAGASLLGSGPTGGRVINKTPEELTNPKKFGGNVQVLLARSLARTRD